MRTCSNTVSLPSELIDRVDRVAGESGRDQFVADAVFEALRRLQLEAIEKFAGSLKDVDIPGWETSESAAEWVHNLRYHPEKLPVPPGDPER